MNSGFELETRLYTLGCKVEGIGLLLSSMDTGYIGSSNVKDAFYGIGLILDDIALNIKGLYEEKVKAEKALSSTDNLN